jgi:hypothetical protein
VQIVVGDRPVRSYTQVEPADRNLAVWETVIAELGVELRSAYPRQPGGDPESKHLLLSPAFVEIHTKGSWREWPVCLSDSTRDLHDHLGQLQVLLLRSDHGARITILPGRLERFRNALRRMRRRRLVANGG